MRLYESKISTNSYPTSIVDLYDELERRAVIALAERHGTNSIRYHFDAVVCMRDHDATPDDALAITEDACALWGLSDPLIERPTMIAFCDRFPQRYALDAIGNGSFVQKADLFEINELIKEKRLFRDWIVTRRPELDDCLRLASATAHSRSLLAEIASMQARDPSSDTSRTHYVIQGSANPSSKDAAAVLLESLLITGHAPSPHVYYINCDNVSSAYRLAFEFDGRLDGFANEALARALDGNVVLVEYGREDFGATYNKSAYALFRTLLQLLRPRLDTTLLVLLLPQSLTYLERHAALLTNATFTTIAADSEGASKGPWDDVPDELPLRTPPIGLMGNATQLMSDVDLDEQRSITFDRMRREWMGARFASTGFPSFPPEVSLNLSRYLGV